MDAVLINRFVAFGQAAAVVLEEGQKPIWKLCALVAYYPDKIPMPSAGWPSGHNVIVHLASSQNMAPKCRHYIYREVQLGFAEKNLDMYDKISAGLAWSRTLAILRKGFEIEVDLERVWEDHAERELANTDHSELVPSFADRYAGVSRIRQQRCGCHDGHYGR